MKKIIYLLIFMSFYSCKKDLATSNPFTFNKSGGSPTLAAAPASMTLLSPASSPAFISNPTIKISGLSSVRSIKVYRNNACSIQIASAEVTSDSVTITTSALPVGTHTFYTITSNQYGSSPCSGGLMSYRYLGVAPTTATSMELVIPASSPGSNPTPQVRLSGVVAGERVLVYIDANCTVAYGNVVTPSDSVSVTLTHLPPGNNDFYTKSINTAGAGPCSSVLLSYYYNGVIPSTATTLSLFYPTVTPNYLSTPTLLASGVVNGDTVYIYTDSSCTNLVGSGAVGIDTSIKIILNPLAIGAHSFYTQSSNIVGTSGCSGALANYSYAGPSPKVEVSWTANHEKAVNSPGGGYRVYTNNDDDNFISVPYVSGPLAPTSIILTNLLKGTNTFQIAAYSTLISPWETSGTVSMKSSVITINVP